jgi:hypothetical protein
MIIQITYQGNSLAEISSNFFSNFFFLSSQLIPLHNTSDIEDQCPPPLLLSSQLEKFRESYKKMSVVHKWVLSSGKCVEDTLFKHCERLPVESILHSWVIDLDDHEVESLFTIEEWNEVQRAVKKMPEADRNFADSMMRFSDVS